MVRFNDFKVTITIVGGDFVITHDFSNWGTTEITIPVV